MIKSELVQRVAEKNLHLHRADLEKVVNAILVQIESALAQRHRVELRGFGVLSVKVRRARAGRNPKTGAVVSVPEKAFPAFRARKEMQVRLNSDEAAGVT